MERQKEKVVNKKEKKGKTLEVIIQEMKMMKLKTNYSKKVLKKE